MELCGLLGSRSRWIHVDLGGPNSILQVEDLQGLLGRRRFTRRVLISEGTDHGVGGARRGPKSQQGRQPGLVHRLGSRSRSQSGNHDRHDVG